MSEAITRAHNTLGQYANVNGTIGRPSLLTLVASKEHECAPVLAYLDDMIEQLQAAREAYEKRIKRDALLSTDNEDVPERLRRDRPAPNDYDVIKIKHDSPLGHRFVNRIDFDSENMELLPNE